MGMKIMSRIKAMVLTDKSHKYDSNCRTGIMSGIISIVSTDKTISMISTEEW